MSDIKVITGEYDRGEFYKVMGRFFAEPQYKKELPYLKNTDHHTWFLLRDNHELIGFSAIESKPSKLILCHDYVIEQHRNKGIWKKMLQARLDYVRGANKPIEITTNHEFMRGHLLAAGFKLAKRTKNYYFFEKGIEE